MELNSRMIEKLYSILASEEEKDFLKEQLRKIELEAKEVIVGDYINKNNYTYEQLYKMVEEKVENEYKSIMGKNTIQLKNLSMDEIIKECRSRYVLWGVREIKAIDNDTLLARCQHGYFKINIDRLFNQFYGKQITQQEYNNYCVTVDEYCDAMFKIIES